MYALKDQQGPTHLKLLINWCKLTNGELNMNQYKNDKIGNKVKKIGNVAASIVPRYASMINSRRNL